MTIPLSTATGRDHNDTALPRQGRTNHRIGHTHNEAMNPMGPSPRQTKQSPSPTRTAFNIPQIRRIVISSSERYNRALSSWTTPMTRTVLLLALLASVVLSQPHHVEGFELSPAHAAHYRRIRRMLSNNTTTDDVNLSNLTDLKENAEEIEEHSLEDGNQTDLVTEMLENDGNKTSADDTVVTQRQIKKKKGDPPHVLAAAACAQATSCRDCETKTVHVFVDFHSAMCMWSNQLCQQINVTGNKEFGDNMGKIDEVCRNVTDDDGETPTVDNETNVPLDLKAGGTSTEAPTAGPTAVGSSAGTTSSPTVGKKMKKKMKKKLTETPTAGPTVGPTALEDGTNAPTAGPTPETPSDDDTPTTEPPTPAPAGETPTDEPPAPEPAADTPTDDDTPTTEPPTPAPAGETPTDEPPAPEPAADTPTDDDAPTTEPPTPAPAGETPTDEPTAETPADDDFTFFPPMGNNVVVAVTVMGIAGIIFYWSRCCRSIGDPSMQGYKGIGNESGATGGIMGNAYRTASSSQYQGVSTTDSDDPDDWGWDDDLDGDLELNDVVTPPSPQSVGRRTTSPKIVSGGGFANKPVAPVLGSPLSRTKTPPTVSKTPAFAKPRGAVVPPPKAAAAPRATKLATLVAAPRTDDIFSEMGLTAQPNFKKSNKPLATRMTMTDSDFGSSWGDEDLDDLLGG